MIINLNFNLKELEKEWAKIQLEKEKEQKNLLNIYWMMYFWLKEGCRLRPISFDQGHWPESTNMVIQDKINLSQETNQIARLLTKFTQSINLSHYFNNQNFANIMKKTWQTKTLTPKTKMPRIRSRDKVDSKIVKIWWAINKRCIIRDSIKEADNIFKKVIRKIQMEEFRTSSSISLFKTITHKFSQI